MLNLGLVFDGEPERVVDFVGEEPEEQVLEGFDIVVFGWAAVVDHRDGDLCCGFALL
jgi:hypothetical protein